MAKLFKGLAMTGAWSCFDEFNRLPVEVLSVVAGQMGVLLRAVASPDPAFAFNGEDLPICKGCAVFVTYNPDYAGRSELPDNLKALFRPCVMIAAATSTIAEISLYAAGFLHPRVCAHKMVRCLSLASEQLSACDHYDWGLRSAKAVITAAARLKRSEPDAPEVGLAFRALVECNVPKITSVDLPIFEGLAKDLFPHGPDTDVDDLSESTPPPTSLLESVLSEAAAAADLDSPARRSSRSAGADSPSKRGGSVQESTATAEGADTLFAKVASGKALNPKGHTPGLERPAWPAFRRLNRRTRLTRPMLLCAAPHRTCRRSSAGSHRWGRTPGITALCTRRSRPCVPTTVCSPLPGLDSSACNSTRQWWCVTG